MEINDWTETFTSIYNSATEKFNQGAETPEAILDAKSIDSIKSMGLKPINFFDWIEDFANGGHPDFNTALLLAAARREFFLYKQGGIWSEKEIVAEDLPPKPEEHAGIPWLPRINQKAQGFLRGELEDNIMYGCGGDRKFFREHAIHPLDFLALVATSRGNLDAIATHLKGSSSDS